MNQLFSTGDVAKLTGIQPYRISYAHITGQLPEPDRVFGKRAYRWDQIRTLANHFGVTVDDEPGRGGRGEEVSDDD